MDIKFMKSLVEDNGSNSSKIFALSIQVLIIISLVSFSISTVPDIDDKLRNVLYGIELFTVAVFTLEYIIRVIAADKKISFVFSFLGLVDLAAILPFYLSTGLDLRTIRIVRLLRLVRILKLIRYNQAIGRFRRALVIVKEELILFCFVAFILLYLAAVGIYYFENEAQPENFKSVFDGLWWAIATLTTVGYGDVYPVTIGGKIFTFIILMVGLGIVAVPTGLVASALSQARNEEGS